MNATTSKLISRRLFASAPLLLVAAPGLVWAQQSVPAAANAQYRLAAGDTIRISVYQSADLTLETRLTEAGTISYPLLGSVALAGLTVSEAEKRIADGLRFTWQVHPSPPDILLDIPIDRARPGCPA